MDKEVRIQLFSIINSEIWYLTLPETNIANNKDNEVQSLDKDFQSTNKYETGTLNTAKKLF